MPAAPPPAALAEAAEAARRGPTLPPDTVATWQDRRDIPLLTIDPTGSRDLDQALFIEPRGGGFRVYYAIADVAAWVTPGGALDADTWQRGLTLYLPDGPARLHPPALSEGVASLLAGQDRPAVLWELDLDADGSLRDARAARALVRSREQLDYPEAQRRIDAAATGATGGAGASGATGPLELLAVVGRLRQQQEIARGGISLQLPEQDVVHEHGRYRLDYRRSLPVEGWNAQLSLLTGMAAAAMMLQADVGVLRVLPPADPMVLERLRRSAAALGVDWPAALSYPSFVRHLDPSDPARAALLQQAARTLRGAAYLALPRPGLAGTTDPAGPTDAPEPIAAPEPTDPAVRHAALASSYTHVTAPLRRLVDRYASEVAVALSAGRPVPTWALERLDALPAAMASAGQRSSQLDGAVVDLVEALLLSAEVGRHFGATVIEADQRRSTVQLDSPAVVTKVDGALPLGRRVELELVAADAAQRRLSFRLAAGVG